MPRRHLHQNICTRSERLVNQADVAAMRALDIEMVAKFANEISTGMVCFHLINLLVDVQFSLVVATLPRYVDF